MCRRWSHGSRCVQLLLERDAVISSRAPPEEREASMTHANDSRRPPSAVTPLALAVIVALWLIPSGLALAATITVTTVADENGTGPNCSLREAVASANGN